MRLKSVFSRMIFYSPKSHVNSLWQEAFILSFRIGLKKGSHQSYAVALSREEIEILREKKYKLINALLDYYFDPEKDREYIKENRVKGMKQSD